MHRSLHIPVSAARPHARGGRAAAVPAGARSDMLTRIDTAEPVWRELEQADAVSTRYQHHAWAGCWWEHVGSRMAAEPLIAVLRDRRGAPAMLLPLIARQAGPVRAATFMGGRHANYKLPMWHPARLGEPAAAVAALIAAIAAAAPDLDLLVLTGQPAAWEGHANPLLALPHQRASGAAYSGALDADYDALLGARMGGTSRKKLRQKERRLAELGRLGFWRARSTADIARVLDAFFDQKAARLRELGLANAFAEPGVREFVTAAATRPDPATGEPAIELHAAALDDRIIATFGGIAGGGRFSGMFNSMAEGPVREHSPGEQLLCHVVRDCCARGLTRFDLGVGEAAYKRVFCPDVEPLYDVVVPLTPAGRLAAAVWRSALAAKRLLKQTAAGRGASNHLSRLAAGDPAE